MRGSSVWRRLLGVANVIVEGVRIDQQDLLIDVRLGTLSARFRLTEAQAGVRSG